MRITRNDFLRHATAAAVAGLCLGGDGRAQSKKKPNILFIFSDDHACQSIGAYGSKINKTPNIDRIAKEGAVFLNNTCGNSICAPSRATVLTGKHSHANGQRQNGDTFDGGQRTFPKLLQQCGYETALIGKWHLRSDPTGFDHWDILPGQGAYYNPQFISPNGKRTVFGYNTDIITDSSIRWMQEDRDQDKPFLLMCQFKAPHRTWMPNLKHLDNYKGQEIPEPDTLFDDYAGRTSSIAQNEASIANHLFPAYDLKVQPPEADTMDAKHDARISHHKMSPAQRKQWDAAFAEENAAYKAAKLEGDDLTRWNYQRYIKNYLRTIDSVDENVGRLLDYLDWAGLADNTIVVYSSDQGFYLGEHGLYDKRWMYEESLSMPLLMRWPGHVKAGTRVEALTQNIDFAPTFLEAAGVTPPGDMHGQSLQPLLDGDTPQDWRDAIYYHYYEKGPHNVAPHEGVRTPRYKLIHFYEVNEWEFYDLKTDPQECTSRYDDPAYATHVAGLRKRLEALKIQYAVPEGDSKAAEK
jgi:arylsulfatase A-like enzyme